MIDQKRQEEVVALCQTLIQNTSYSGHEDGVVHALRNWMGEHGFDSVETDDYGNLIGRIKGSKPGP